jgi:DNA-binding NarL/FixJ family response regulator
MSQNISCKLCSPELGHGKMSLKKTILIVDDHPVIRQGLKAIITNSSGSGWSFEVIGEAETGHQALEMIGKLKPDICLLDISLPDQSGLSLIIDLKRILPNVRIIMLSMHSKIDFITEAIKAGAAGYVVKSSTADKLIGALKAVSKGEYYIDGTVSTELFGLIKNISQKKKRIEDSSFQTLTDREQEICRLLVKGHDPNKIADKLFISPKTVKNHKANIMQKLDIHNYHELLRYAVKIGLLDLDQWG